MLQARSPGSVGDEAGGKVRLRRSRFLGATVTIAAVLAVLLIILFLELLAYLLEGKVVLGRSRVEAAAAVARGTDQATFFVRLAAGDIRIIAQGDALRSFAGGTTRDYEGVKRVFRAFLEAKPTITQLRFLDIRGNEAVRVERVGDAVVTVAPEGLQPKANRYYFKDAVVLPPDGIYLSPLDLNVEHGSIQVPWQPMLRLATPVLTPSGETGGVVVMNLDASNLLSAISEVRFAETGSIALLNQSGYWLAGVTPERLWGFMFDNGETLARADAGLWRTIEETGTGEFDYQDRQYVVDTVRPEALLSVGPEGATTHSADARWIVLARVPARPPFLTVERWPQLLLTLLASVLVGVFCARLIQARRRAEAEKRKSAAELIRVDRMASLGGLVAGIAHELNTPLGNALSVSTTVSERVDTLTADVREGRIRRSSLESLLKDIREGTDLLVQGLGRASEIVRHFKQVAVDQASERRRSFPVDQYVEDVVQTLRPQFKGSAVVLEPEPGSTAVIDSYPGALAQVITNLVANAQIHAFAPNEAGRIAISTRDLLDGGVEIDVRDNGAGMSPDVLARMFDPFFTTRLGTGGSGLGLSIVYNIVTGTLGGTISAQSRLREGSVVSVRLPASAPSAGTRWRRSDYDVERSAHAH